MSRQKNIYDSVVHERNAASASNFVTNSKVISFEQQKELLLLKEQIAQCQVERNVRIAQFKRDEDELLAQLKRDEDERLA